MARITKQTTLYTLIVNPDQTFEIRLDGTRVKNGTLLEDFSPSVNPPTEIDDPDDTKPEDWVEKAKIVDPEAKKPEDWDEDAPYEITDEEAEKPEDWLEDEPEFVPDPEAEKPEDWDDEEDGDWLPPTVSNPKCEAASGCGKWSKPLKLNPAYKGKWNAPMIDNPDYKGPWAPRKIPNPSHFEDKTPSNFEPMGAIGFELWTMTKDILFDNIYIGHSVQDAEKLQKETFDVKKKIETEEDAASAPVVPEAPKAPGETTFKEDPVTFIRDHLEIFFAAFQRDPMFAIKEFPVVAGSFTLFVASFITILFSLIFSFGSSPAPKKPTKAPATDKKADKKANESTSEGTESEKPKANRRTSKKAE